MWYRLLDFLWVVALVAVCCSGTGLMIFGVWKVGQELLKALYIGLVCLEYGLFGEAHRSVLLRDPIARRVLRLDSPYQVFAPLPLIRLSRLDELEKLRTQQASQNESDLIWEPLLGGLLTTAERNALFDESGPATPKR